MRCARLIRREATLQNLNEIADSLIFNGLVRIRFATIAFELELHSQVE